MNAPFRFSPRVFSLSIEEFASSRAGRDSEDGHALLARALRGFGVERRPILLDSAAGWPCDFSLLAFDPLDVGEGAGSALERFEDLEPFSARLISSGNTEEVPGPFHGGFLGALSYDLGVPGERQDLPHEPWGFPKIVGGLYTDFFVYSAAQRGLWLVLGDEPGDGRRRVEERRQGVESALRTALRAPEETMQPTEELRRHTPAREHEARIEELRARIARGEFYQASLAHRFTRGVIGNPVELYLRLRASNPAPYAGFMHWRDRRGVEGALCCTSPELLLESTRIDGRRVARTRPIKGTSPRSADAEQDRRSARDLLNSEKDRAELAMIVDLERNDLGRTARTGTVVVEEFPALRSYERVHHLTADVVAEPRAELGTWQVLAALFPGGSVTGAPKLASMDAIAELEREGRGFFCGSLGFVDTRGEARFNVLIRTALWRPIEDEAPGADGKRRGTVSFRVGGGITWSSRAADEDAETLAKASAMLDALEGSGPSSASTDAGQPIVAPECRSMENT